MEIPDWYAFISTKYCRICAADTTRENKAAWARAFRRKQREKNKATRELCMVQREEIDAMRKLITRQREEISYMKKILKEE